MITRDPELRPSADEALRDWYRLREGIYTVNKEWRPRPREENALGIALDVMSLCDISLYYTRALFEGLFRQQPRRPL